MINKDEFKKIKFLSHGIIEKKLWKRILSGSWTMDTYKQ